jgi:hypothetical protein
MGRSTIPERAAKAPPVGEGSFTCTIVGVADSESHGVATQRATAPSACSSRPPSYDSAPAATPTWNGKGVASSSSWRAAGALAGGS